MLKVQETGQWRCSLAVAKTNQFNHGGHGFTRIKRHLVWRISAKKPKIKLKAVVSKKVTFLRAGIGPGWSNFGNHEQHPPGGGVQARKQAARFGGRNIKSQRI
jgi:hypothetical protein